MYTVLTIAVGVVCLIAGIIVGARSTTIRALVCEFIDTASHSFVAKR